MRSILEDIISYKSTENHGSSSHQMENARDEKVRDGLSSASGSVRHKHESFSDMLMWLKGVAVDHRVNPSSRNFRESWSQNLSARKVLYLSNVETPWRKRTFNQLQETVRSAANVPNKQSSSKRRKDSTDSSYSCVINYAAPKVDKSNKIQNSDYLVRSLKLVDYLSTNGIQTLQEPDVLEMSSPSNMDVLPVLESDDSISGSNGSCFRKLHVQISQHRPIKLLKSGTNDPRKQVCIHPYPDEYVKVSNPKLEKASNRKTSCNSSTFVGFIGDYLPRMAIPVGPRFQADISDLINSTKHGSEDVDAPPDDSDKWLGTRIWPIEGKKAENNMELIGKGRPNSCSCSCPESPECIKLHVMEKREQLSVDLSSAFFSWKFNEMGEEVSKSWKPIEEKSFRMLVKSNPLSKNMSFWEPALKCFPSKSRENIVSYYFNVFVLRRMGRQTRLTFKDVDSDDDEIDDGMDQSNKT